MWRTRVTKPNSFADQFVFTFICAKKNIPRTSHNSHCSVLFHLCNETSPSLMLISAMVDNFSRYVVVLQYLVMRVHCIPFLEARLHIPSMSSFSVPFTNGFNAILRRCLTHNMKKIKGASHRSHRKLKLTVYICKPGLIVDFYIVYHSL